MPARYTSTPTKSSLRGTHRVFSLRYYKKPNCGGAWGFLHIEDAQSRFVPRVLDQSKKKNIERKEKVKKIGSSKSHRRVYACDKKELESREREKKRDRLGSRWR
uniref:Uncharacterized protein n=1 Tax=Trichogramma kaykai TaxID=54128 RepID=A0ABD2X474_9HYME